MAIAGVIEARRLLDLERPTIRELAEVERGGASLRRSGTEGRTAEHG